MTRDFRFVAWDLLSLEPLGPPIIMAGGWNGEAATADNRLLAAGTGDAGLVVFDVATGTPVASFTELGSFVPSVSFSVDGSRLAAAGITGGAVVWDTATWLPIDGGPESDLESVLALRYSPDGRFLVTMDPEGNVSLRDPQSNEVQQVLIGSGAIDLADGVFFFSADGRYMVTAADGAARLWDLDEGLEIGDPFPNDPDNRIGGADGLPRFVTAVGGYRLVWELDIEAWPTLACELAGRNLTRDEWEQFGPAGEPYALTCENWPAPPAPDRFDGEPSTTAASPALETTSAEAGEIGDADPVALADEAAAVVLDLLRADSFDEAERSCESWEPRLVAASDTATEIRRSEIGADTSHRFWTIDIAINLCAGKGFDTALTYLSAIERNPTGACVGYPSPCPTPRRSAVALEGTP